MHAHLRAVLFFVFYSLCTARADVAILQLQASTNLSSEWMSVPLRDADLTESGSIELALPPGLTNGFFRMGIQIMTDPVLPVNVGVRLTYFYAEGGGDPAMAPNPHSIRQAVSSDGANFTNEVQIFSADNLVDPDLFRIGTNSYGLLVTDHSSTNLIYARATNVAGTYTNTGDTFPPMVTQSSTIDMGGSFRVFSSGIFAYSFVPSRGVLGTNIPSLGLTAMQIGKTNGICADPSVIRLDDGRYRMFFKYSPMGGTPRQHELWQITSTDASGNSWNTNTASYITNGSVPGAVRDGQNVLIYFVSFDPELSPNNSLAVGVSTNQGTNFSFYPVFLNGSPFAGGYDPSALLLSE
jgi:hypothetical protein